MRPAEPPLSPGPEALAVIEAALAIVLAAAPTDRPAAAPRWRFSGRWWSEPPPARRARP